MKKLLFAIIIVHFSFVAFSQSMFLNTEPAWSPDGEQIVFVSKRNGNNEIYVMNKDGSNLKRLTNTEAYENDPGFSPDGNKILFVSKRDKVSQVYVMDKDGSNQVNLTKTKKNESDPCWSPDGSKIAFQSTRNATSQIYIMNSDGSDAKRVTKLTYNNSFPKWSPDGKKLLCLTIGPSGYKSSIIYLDDDNSDINLPFRTLYTLDCFSKDNKKVLGHLNHFGNSQSASDSLFIYDIDAHDLKIIPIDISDVLSAQFSTNEDNILVEANYNTYLIGIDGENKLTIQNGILAKYSPKEDLILCVTNDERMDVGTIKTDGTGFINLTKD